MSDVVLRFVKTHGANIISDGDIDGVFATGLLLRALIKERVNAVYHGNVLYPRARELERMEADGNILIEIHPQKGIKYRGTNLLIDHHPEPPYIALYNDTNPILVRKYQLSTSVAGLIYHIFKDKIDAPEELVHIVDQVDYRNYELEEAHKLARAFLISRNLPENSLKEIFNSTLVRLEDTPLFKNLEQMINKSPIYGLLTLAITIGDWDTIYEWIEKESKRYEKEIIPVAKRMYSHATVDKEVSYIVYNYGNLKERTAVEDVFYTLQKESHIAMMIGVTKNGYLVRIASFDPKLNLISICTSISDKRIQCGGRENVIGLYFPNRFFTLTDVLRITQQALQKQS